jgi:NAD(P)H dehydrogenase (quinone)
VELYFNKTYILSGGVKMLIIYAHPNKEGHCGSILKHLTGELKNKKIASQLLDLYEMNFNPVLQPQEHYTSGHTNVAPQIRAIQEKIKESGKLIFIYPTWWQGPPAILKGFIDKVLLPGFAFSYEGGSPKGLLSDKKAILFVTTGAPREMTKKMAEDRSIKALQVDSLGFCGIDAKHFVLDSCMQYKPARDKEIKELVKKGLSSIL